LYLPRNVAGAARAVLEFHSDTKIEYEGVKAPFSDVKEATNAELLVILGFTPDAEGIKQFLWVKQHWIALICHNFKLPHNCGEYCPGYVFGPYLSQMPVYRSEYDRLAAKYNHP
jgi:hypothetical protein